MGIALLTRARHGEVAPYLEKYHASDMVSCLPAFGVCQVN
jgi:hypothetical protein